MMDQEWSGTLTCEAMARLDNLFTFVRRYQRMTFPWETDFFSFDCILPDGTAYTFMFIEGEPVQLLFDHGNASVTLQGLNHAVTITPDGNVTVENKLRHDL